MSILQSLKKTSHTSQKKHLNICFGNTWLHFGKDYSFWAWKRGGEPCTGRSLNMQNWVEQWKWPWGELKVQELKILEERERGEQKIQ